LRWWVLWPQKQESLRMGDAKKLVCIYTCDKDKHSLSQFKKTKLYKQLKLDDSCCVLEVYAGASETKLEGGVLQLNCPEEYSKLSLKTYEMIKECSSRFAFDYLVKIDCNIFEYGKVGFGFTEELRSDFFCEEFVSTLIFDDHLSSDYSGSAVSYVRTSDSLSKWATHKNIKILKTDPKYHVPFFTGKFYSMSSDFCNFISENGLFDASYFADNLGGAEDVFIGYLFSEFNKLNFKSDILLDYVVNVMNLVKHENTKCYLRRLVDICREDFKKFEFEQTHCVNDERFNEHKFKRVTSAHVGKVRFLQDVL
jgi:hypothetical protein